MRRDRQPTAASIIAVLTLAFALGSCGVSVVPTPAATATVETPAVPGLLHMSSDGRYDQARLQLSYVVGGVPIEGESIDADIEVIVNRPFPPGSMLVLYNDLICGSVQIVSNMETDVLLDFGVEACMVSTTDTHPSGSIKHPELPNSASVGGLLPFGMRSVFVVRSLDKPDAGPAAQVTVDAPPWETDQFFVLPGRYEVSALVRGVLLASDELDLERGESRVVNLRALPGDIPRDCGETATAQCELAIAAGYAGGLFLQDYTTVSAASVRPTKYRSCDSAISPEFDVTFQLMNPKGEIEVTVGRLPSGRLTACTY